ncbi:MAG: endonuclease/exonuclease/phosphatase family protein [Bacteroidales bacterium]|nr:endonuclease/exonuclease/phosphatase family protein [Bacteroidales bacterium]
MKRLLLIATLVIAAIGTLAAQTGNKKQYRVYGVAFYNLENLFDTINNNGKYDLEYSPQGSRQWNTQKYRSKIHNLAYCITRMTSKTTPNGPAVIGVSEIENRSVLVDLTAEIDRILSQEGRQTWNLQIVHHDSPDRRGVDVSCLYNPRQFRFIDVTNSRLTIPGYETFRTRDQMCVTGILGGDTLSIIVNHWPSRLGGQEQSSYLREAAADLSKHIADSLWTLRPNQGVIVMGDLNDDPDDRSCAINLGANKKIDKTDTHSFYNPWWEMLDKGIGTLAYKGAWNLFDQIIISGTLLEKNNPDALQYWRCQVNNFEFLRDTEGTRQHYPKRTFAAGAYLDGYSDHFPTEVFLRKLVK